MSDLTATVPMKVIKVGANAPPRIAQACDRCRSKKIRCDGVRPICTQCSSVGFECKTSDKLSRRAFPRGYTESLEERVRALEGEVRHLKGIVLEKSREIERLSSLPIDRATSADRPVSSPACAGSQTGSASEAGSFEAIISGNQDTSGARFQHFEVNRLLQKLQTRLEGEFQSYVLLPPVSAPSEAPVTSCHPPSAATDGLVDLFFSKWASLFPILSRGHFMEYYKMARMDQRNPRLPPYALAQIYLVFSIVENSKIHEQQTSDEAAYYTQQWQLHMDGISDYWKVPNRHLDSSMTMPLLQTVLLASIECLQSSKADRLAEYMEAASTFCTRLDLHNSQDQRTELTPYERETRKRAFWCYYTLESFAAMQLEVEMRMTNFTIACEFPDDWDMFNDAILPGSGSQDSAPLASALALFRLARILVQIWGDLGPPYYTMSFSSDALSSRLISFQNLLEVWLSGLPCQLRVQRYLERQTTAKDIEDNSFFLRFAFNAVSCLIPKAAIRVSEWTSLSMSYILICKQALRIVLYIKDRKAIVPLPLNYPYQVIQFILPILSHAIDKPLCPEDIEDTSQLVHSALLLLRSTSANNAATELSRVIELVLPKWNAALQKTKGKAVKESSTTKEGNGDVSQSEWAELVSLMDGGGLNNIYDNIYGGPGAKPMSTGSAATKSSSHSPSVTTAQNIAPTSHPSSAISRISPASSSHQASLGSQSSSGPPIQPPTKIARGKHSAHSSLSSFPAPSPVEPFKPVLHNAASRRQSFPVSSFQRQAARANTVSSTTSERPPSASFQFFGQSPVSSGVRPFAPSLNVGQKSGSSIRAPSFGTASITGVTNAGSSASTTSRSSEIIITGPTGPVGPMSAHLSTPAKPMGMAGSEGRENVVHGGGSMMGPAISTLFQPFYPPPVVTTAAFPNPHAEMGQSGGNLGIIPAGQQGGDAMSLVVDDVSSIPMPTDRQDALNILEMQFTEWKSQDRAR